jgi:signal transduction histidine kinase
LKPTAPIQIDTQSGDWNIEMRKLMSKYLFIGALIAVMLNPIFGLVDYFTLHDYWLEFLAMRCMVSGLVLGCIFYSPLIRKRPELTGLIVMTLITTQDAFLFSQSNSDTIHNNALSYLVDFVGASMVLLWTLPLAVGYLVLLMLVNVTFFNLLSPMDSETYLTEGGLLVFAGAVFSMAMIVFRHHSVKSMLISRSELIRYNEWMAVQNDIIEQKSEELQRSNSRLKEFAYIVSHDLKTPLRGIKNLASWIREDCAESLTEEGKSHLRLIDKQVQKMENLILGVLEYAKSGHVNAAREWIHLDELIQELIETVDVDKKVKFRVNAHVPALSGTRIVLSQVLQNLITNSIKHNLSFNKEVEIEILGMEDMVQFRISDNGPGIDEKDHHRIFDLFQTLATENLYDNTGIGLPVAKKMVEEAGGHMWLESKKGKGASFYFTLPRSFSEMP